MRHHWIWSVVILLALTSACSTNKAINYSNENEFFPPNVRDVWLDDGRGCSTKEDEFLTQDGIAAMCVRVLYATNRRQETVNDVAQYQSDPDDVVHFGYSEVAVPLIKRSPKRSREDGRTLYRETFTRFEKLRAKDEEKARRLGIARLTANIDNAYDFERVAFIKDVSQFGEKSNDAVLLYIPGWGHSFDDALFSIAKLSQDLAFNFANQLEILGDEKRKYPLGQPVLFSWPTAKFDEFIWDAYTRDRDRSRVAG